jgi:branched-chain amino acid aminotransferase
MSYVNINGEVKKEEEVLISPHNRAFRYADGFFETIRLFKGKIVLEDLHFERLYYSLNVLKFQEKSFPSKDIIVDQIKKIVEKNEITTAARIRLTVFAGDGALHQNVERIPNYIIQVSSLDEVYILNEQGLVIDIFKDAVKPCDILSPVKSNNFLPYVMGSLWCKEQQLNDCILLNPYGNIADATIANVFIVKDGHIQTPPITDGPVDGVMRKYLLPCLRQNDIPYKEVSLTAQDVLQASEVFLTNAIKGISWVKRLGRSGYTNELSTYLHKKFIAPLTT